MKEAMRRPNLENCRFPTTTRRDKERGHFDRVKVDHVSDQTDASDKSFIQCSSKLLQASWAILLRNYIGSELISFAVLSSSSRSDLLEINTPVSHITPEPRILVYQYQVSGVGRLEELCEDGCWIFSARDLGDTRINTAVQFSDWRSTTSQAQEADNLFGFDANNTSTMDCVSSFVFSHWTRGHNHAR